MWRLWVTAILFFSIWTLLSPETLPADGGVPHGGGGRAGNIEISEKLGQYIASDAVFRDETGRRVTAGRIVDRPTIIAPVYLSCTHTCPMLLSGLAEALGKIDLKPGRDFKVLSVSFDEHDTPAVASDKKRNYLKAIGKPFPEEAWIFLTGDLPDILKLTGSVGFNFRREKEGFSHPVALIILSPDGKIVRYLYGTNFLPFDLTMALTEASEGRVGSTARKVLLYCFSYDPLQRTYVFNILKVAGLVLVVLLVSFFGYLIFTGRKREKTA